MAVVNGLEGNLKKQNIQHVILSPNSFHHHVLYRRLPDLKTVTITKINILSGHTRARMSNGIAKLQQEFPKLKLYRVDRELLLKCGKRVCFSMEQWTQRKKRDDRRRKNVFELRKAAALQKLRERRNNKNGRS